MNRPGISAAAWICLLLAVGPLSGCTDGHYDAELGPTRPVDPIAGTFLKQFEGVWTGSTWGNVTLVVKDKKLYAYPSSDTFSFFFILQPFGMVDEEKRLVSVAITRKNIPKKICTSEEVTKWVKQLPAAYALKASTFIALNQAELEKWMSVQSAKFDDLLPTLNSHGMAVTGEPELADAIKQAENYQGACEVLADTKENAVLRNVSATAGAVEPFLSSEFGGNQNFTLVRQIDDDDRAKIAEKTKTSELDKLDAESLAAASLIDAKLMELNKLLDAVDDKNTEATEWLNSYRDTCLKNHPRGGGRAADMLHGTGEISGFDWRPVRDVVRICSGNKI